MDPPLNNLLLLVSWYHVNKIRGRKRQETQKLSKPLAETVDGCMFDFGTDPREPIPPRETPEEKLQRFKREKRAALVARETHLRNKEKLYNIPLRLIHMKQAFKYNPAMKDQWQIEKKAAKRRNEQLQTRFLQVNHRGDVVGKSKLLGHNMPLAFYRTHPLSVFRNYRYYHHQGYHPDPAMHLRFVKGDEHHHEHHKEVDAVVGKHLETPKLYQQFRKTLAEEIRSTQQREQQAARQKHKEKSSSFFPIYSLFGRTPHPVYINPAFVPLGSKVDLLIENERKKHTQKDREQKRGVDSLCPSTSSLTHRDVLQRSSEFLHQEVRDNRPSHVQEDIFSPTPPS